MDNSSQALIYVVFGEKYKEQFMLSLRTVPAGIDVYCVTDQPHSPGNYRTIPTNTPANVYDILTERQYIDLFVDIKHYDRIWYADPDILFTDNIFEKYKNRTDVLVSNEPDTSLLHPAMHCNYSSEKLTEMIRNGAPAVNGGFFSIPSSEYENFFTQYRELIEWYTQLYPKEVSTDQHALNILYHEKLVNMALFDAGDVGFPSIGAAGKYVNHYVGMHLDKRGTMAAELKLRGL